MVKQQQQRYQVFLKVRDFGARHSDQFPASSAAGRAFATVAEAAATIERQSSERLVNAQAGKKARAEARKALWDRLKAIVRSARVIASDPPARDVFRLPKRRSDVAILDTAHAFIDAGEAASAQWVAFGLPETALAELREMTTTFAKAMDSRRQGQTGVKDARKALKDALEYGFAAVRHLDVIVANTKDPDSAIAVSWNEARRSTPVARHTKDTATGTAPELVVPVTAPPAVPSTTASTPGAGGDNIKRVS